MSDNKEYDSRIYRYTGKVYRYMELAKRIAFQSDYPDYRHGAVLVKGGSIRNTSHNKNNFCSFGSRFRKRQTGKATVHGDVHMHYDTDYEELIDNTLVYNGASVGLRPGKSGKVINNLVIG